MTGQPDAAAILAAKAQIQMLADEIAALRTITDDDPRWATADQIVEVKAGAIRTLRTQLPGIPDKRQKHDSTLR